MPAPTPRTGTAVACYENFDSADPSFDFPQVFYFAENAHAAGAYPGSNLTGPCTGGILGSSDSGHPLTTVRMLHFV